MNTYLNFREKRGREKRREETERVREGDET